MQFTAPVVDANLHELITGIHESGESFYPVEKLDAHQRNVPHVAISIFVFRGDELLVQRRADTKYHSGGLWANSVCSHPRWDETAGACATRRLQEELGWTVPLNEFGQIDYAAQVGSLFENERVHCFYGDFDSACSTDNFNTDEVSAVRWTTIDNVIEEIDRRPETFSAWFRIYMAKHRAMIKQVVEYRQAQV